MPPIVFSFDVETAGKGLHDPVLGIGACVLDVKTGQVRATLRQPMYCPEDKLEAYSGHRFWTSHPVALDHLKTNTSRAQCEAQAIRAFHDFRVEWETYAKKNRQEYVVVSDNPSFDASVLNRLSARYTSPAYPYTTLSTRASDGKFQMVRDIESMALGFIRALGLTFTRGDPYVRLGNAGIVPLEARAKPHTPDDDAVINAHRYMQLMQVRLQRRCR